MEYNTANNIFNTIHLVKSYLVNLQTVFNFLVVVVFIATDGVFTPLNLSVLALICHSFNRSILSAVTWLILHYHMNILCFSSFIDVDLTSNHLKCMETFPQYSIISSGRSYACEIVLNTINLFLMFRLSC